MNYSVQNRQLWITNWSCCKTTSITKTSYRRNIHNNKGKLLNLVPVSVLVVVISVVTLNMLKNWPFIIMVWAGVSSEILSISKLSVTLVNPAPQCTFAKEAKRLSLFKVWCDKFQGKNLTGFQTWWIWIWLNLWWKFLFKMTLSLISKVAILIRLNFHSTSETMFSTK